MKLGVVGLPNVGKSTLFNAITKAGAEAANYPFCTIEPNTGVVAVPDERLNELSEMYHPKKTTPAVIEFVDIAGLVKGASHGEGLGNKFLSHIRECEAIVHVVRCFEDPDIIRHADSLNPQHDIETINLEPVSYTHLSSDEILLHFQNHFGSKQLRLPRPHKQSHLSVSYFEQRHFSYQTLLFSFLSCVKLQNRKAADRGNVDLF